MSFDRFACPVCGAALSVQGGSCVCPARHTFDIARKGYVNLLTGRAGAVHGDDRAMLEARRRFLDTGHYAPLRDRVASLVASLAGDGATLLDAGCGECYYTAAVENALRDTRVPFTLLGVDISREALALGARRTKTVPLAVASLYKLPLAAGSVDILYELFAPFCLEEFSRVLKPGGYMLLAIPGARHLFGLKEVLYDTPYENEEQDTALPGFTLVSREALDYTVTLETAEEIADLFTMTPYYYRTSERDKAKLTTHGPLQTPVSFTLLLYRRD